MSTSTSSAVRCSISNSTTINADANSQKTCGLEDDDQYEIPRPDGDPYQICLDLFLEEDRAKCQAWNDEVETLLIFAGLFSAVVTAFVVQSYQSLVPNPTDQITLLLAILASNVNSSLAATPAVMNSMASQEPSSSTTRVNILWFLSLVLSLSTVLVGIVSLQWIREYQHYSGISSTKRKLALRNMRTEGLERWLVPEILAGLPLLLQTALILFFVGIVDFLVNLKIEVAIPVIVVVALTLFFILATIVLPAAQCFWMVNVSIPRNTGHLPVQCPYKSAQSRIFFRMISSKILHNVIAIAFFPFSFGFFLILPLCMPLYHSMGIVSEWLHALVDFFANFSDSIQTTRIRSWVDFDGVYLSKRQQIITQTEQLRTKTQLNGECIADCDVARGIARVVNQYGYDNSLIFAAYHCFRDLPNAVLTPEVYAMMSTENSTASPIYRSPRLSDLLPDSDSMIRFRQHENEILFLEQLPQVHTNNFLPTLRKRQLELFIKMTKHVLTSRTYVHLGSEEARVTSSSPLRCAFNGSLYIPQILRNVTSAQLIPDEIAKDIHIQLCAIFKSFILTAIDSQGRELSVFCDREDIITDYMELMHTITLDALERDNHSSSSADMGQPSLFERITDIVSLLCDHIHPSMPQTMQLLFYSGILYVCHFEPEELTRLGRRAPMLVVALKTLVRCLKNYQLSQMRRLAFLVRNKYFLTQWNKITVSLLSDLVTNPSSYGPPEGGELGTQADAENAENETIRINVERSSIPSTVVACSPEPQTCFPTTMHRDSIFVPNIRNGAHPTRLPCDHPEPSSSSQGADNSV